MATDDPNIPYIHPPPVKEDDPKNGLMCFLHQERECGGDCMAYQTFAPPGQDYENQQWANCMLLIGVHRVGKHLTLLAQLKNSEVIDRKRAAQPPPPKVR